MEDYSDRAPVAENLYLAARAGAVGVTGCFKEIGRSLQHRADELRLTYSHGMTAPPNWFGGFYLYH